MASLKLALRLLVAGLCLAGAMHILIDAGLPLRGDRLPWQSGAAIGLSAPNLSLPNLAGDAVSLAGNGSTASLLYFWSVSCAPCRREMPQLQRLQEDYADALRILAVNLGDDAATVASWRHELGLSYELLLDPAFTSARRYQIRGLPSSFLLDERGLIQALFFGPVRHWQLRAYLRTAGRKA